MENGPIYLDHAATTPCDPRVVEAMLPYFGERFANPSSRTHRPGRDAALAVEDARRRIARALGAGAASEIVFTSGATEANNLALKGLARALAARGRRIVTQATEHASVLEPLRRLAREGFELTVVGVDRRGRVRLDELEAALADGAVLAALMAANNETGTLQPVREAAELAHRHGALLHCDAAQAAGKVPLELDALGADTVALSAHKLYGPKGVGALWIRRGLAVRPEPLLDGGGQEGGLRPGTLNVPGIVGFAVAVELAVAARAEEAARLARLRDRLEGAILGELDGVSVSGDPGARLPGVTNLAFEGVDGEALLASLPDLAVSSGAACSAGSPEPSPVLRAMGLPPDLARASLRLAVGRFTTEAEVDRAAARIVEEVRRLRRLG